MPEVVSGSLPVQQQLDTSSSSRGGHLQNSAGRAQAALQSSSDDEEHKGGPPPAAVLLDGRLPVQAKAAAHREPIEENVQVTEVHPDGRPHRAPVQEAPRRLEQAAQPVVLLHTREEDSAGSEHPRAASWSVEALPSRLWHEARDWLR